MESGTGPAGSAGRRGWAQPPSQSPGRGVRPTALLRFPVCLLCVRLTCIAGSLYVVFWPGKAEGKVGPNTLA